MPPRAKPYPIEYEAQILALWELGHGQGAIALELKIPTSFIVAVCKRHGLRRTKAESLAIRSQNKLHYGNGPRGKMLKESA